jgi:hypothetical protein
MAHRGSDSYLLASMYLHGIGLHAIYRLSVHLCIQGVGVKHHMRSFRSISA